jgi:hypothetical protein
LALKTTSACQFQKPSGVVTTEDEIPGMAKTSRTSSLAASCDEPSAWDPRPRKTILRFSQGLDAKTKTLLASGRREVVSLDIPF